MSASSRIVTQFLLDRDDFFRLTKDMNNKLVVVLAVLVGIVLLIAACVYFIEPAKSLPSFFPGYNSTLARHHYTHGVGTLVLGLVAFAFAWFQSGKKSSQ